jgi:hypothetical protein
MRPAILFCAVLAIAAVPSPVWAAQTIFEEAFRLDAGKLAIVLIFGTGLIATLCWGITAMIGASRGSADAKDLQQHLDELEDRIEVLEKRLSAGQLNETIAPGSGR